MTSKEGSAAREAAHAVIADSFVDTIRRVLLITSALSLASAAAAAFTIRNPQTARGSPSAH
jgi:hypothetical protein